MRNFAVSVALFFYYDIIYGIKGEAEFSGEKDEN
jgi:hypothetical protein